VTSFSCWLLLIRCGNNYRDETEGYERDAFRTICMELQLVNLPRFNISQPPVMHTEFLARSSSSVFLCPPLPTLLSSSPPTFVPL